MGQELDPDDPRLGSDPDWLDGYYRGKTGAPAPKLRREETRRKRYLLGWRAGRKMYCWELWCKKHGREAVYDGNPVPAHDPVPRTPEEVDRWLVVHLAETTRAGDARRSKDRMPGVQDDRRRDGTKDSGWR